MELKELQDQLHDFVATRGWGRSHDPKNLALALAGEVGELCAVFQWLSADEANSVTTVAPGRAEEEIADTFIYLLLLADALGVDLVDTAASKLAVNAGRFPVRTAQAFR